MMGAKTLQMRPPELAEPSRIFVEQRKAGSRTGRHSPTLECTKRTGEDRNTSWAIQKYLPGGAVRRCGAGHGAADPPAELQVDLGSFGVGYACLALDLAFGVHTPVVQPVGELQPVLADREPRSLGRDRTDQ